MGNFTLVHLSDLHIADKSAETTSNLTVLRSAVCDALSTSSENTPRLLVVSGDLVDRPTPESIATAQAFLKAIVTEAGFTETLVIPGNHDVKKTFGMFNRTKDFNNTFAMGDTPAKLLLRECGLHLVGIDSTPAKWARGKIKQREYDKMVMEAYNTELLPDDERKGLVRIVAVHHPPLPLARGEGQKVYGIPDESFMYLQSPATFLNACLNVSVALILHGHRHVTGLTRYSVPTNKAESYWDAAWSNVFVLSCPSSTGCQCDAGFNLIMPHTNSGCLAVRRYGRDTNKGMFKILDPDFPDGIICLRYQNPTLDTVRLSDESGSVSTEVGSDTLRILSQIANGVQETSDVSNSAFRRGVRTKLEELRREVEQLKTHRIRIPPDEAGRFLVELYRGASKSVFCTRLKKFTGTFRRSSLPEKILGAQHTAKAQTTRVFVFNKIDDISGFDFREMAREDGVGIAVRVLIAPSSRELGTDDFAIVDDEAVGRTVFTSPHEAAAEWSFQLKPELHDYQHLRDRLLKESVPYDEFKSEHQKRFALWEKHALIDVTYENVHAYQEISTKAFGKEAAPEEVVLRIQKLTGGGIYLLNKEGARGLSHVGILAIFPLSKNGFRRFEQGGVAGRNLTADDVHNDCSGPALAYYLGSIAGTNGPAKAALVSALNSILRELADMDVESVFARPVTKDGVKLLTNLRFDGGNATASPKLNVVCRLRLGK